MRNIIITILTATVLAAHAVWMAAGALAATRLTEDLADLFRMAQFVIEADVLDSQPAGAGREGIPMTQATLKIVRVIKGEAAVGDVTVAEYLGGRNGERITVAPGQARLVPGSRVILLLSKFKDMANWRVIGGDAGQIDMEGETARRACGSPFSFYVKDPASITGFSARKTTELSAAMLDCLLRALANTGRPEIEAPKGQVMNVSAPAMKHHMPATQIAFVNQIQHNGTSNDWSIGSRIAVTMSLLLAGFIVSRPFTARKTARQQ